MGYQRRVLFFFFFFFFFFFVKNLKTFSLFFIKTNFLFSYLLKNKIFLSNLIKIFDNIFKILYFFSDKNLTKFKYYLFKFCFSKNIFSKKILVKKVNYKIILGNNFNSNFNLKEFCLFFYSWLYYKVFFNYFFFIICQKFSKLLILLRLRGFELYYHLLKRGENKRLSLGIKPINLVTTFNRRFKKGFSVFKITRDITKILDIFLYQKKIKGYYIRVKGRFKR